MTTNRTAAIAKVYKVLKKHYKPAAPPADRSVLEHLLYACLLENARFDAADEAFARLKELYFDWNEIRVTTVTELAEGMTGIPDASNAAQRVKQALQSVFEGSYSFDLEALKKQNIGKSEKDLEKINGTTPFVRAYVTQNGLEGHSIPVSRGAIEVLHAMGIINDAEADKGLVPGLERAIPKNKGVEFGSLLQQIGADFHASPGSSKLKGILAEVDPDYKERLTKRQTRLEEQAAAQVVAAKEARQKARAEARAAAAALETRPPGKPTGKGSYKAGPSDQAKQKGKEAPPPARPPAPPAPTKKTAEPAPAAKAPVKTTASKGLAKKKPR
jgi:endonuclease III